AVTWRRRAREGGGRLPDRNAAVVFLAACLLVPLTALTLSVQRSPVVGSILIPAAAWAVTLVVLPPWAAHRAPGSPGRPRGVLAAVAALALGAGTCTQLASLSGRSPFSLYKADAEQVVGLFDRIAVLCTELAWQSPRIAVDRNYDFAAPGLL